MFTLTTFQTVWSCILNGSKNKKQSLLTSTSPLNWPNSTICPWIQNKLLGWHFSQTSYPKPWQTVCEPHYYATKTFFQGKTQQNQNHNYFNIFGSLSSILEGYPFICFITVNKNCSVNIFCKPKKSSTSFENSLNFKNSNFLPQCFWQWTMECWFTDKIIAIFSSLWFSSFRYKCLVFTNIKNVIQHISLMLWFDKIQCCFGCCLWHFGGLLFGFY